VDDVFDRVKATVLGPGFVRARGDKNIFVGHRPEFSIPGLYRQAAIEEATRPAEKVAHSLGKVAGSYIDAERERTKAQVTKAVQDWLRRGRATNLETVLGGELGGLFTKAVKSVNKIVDTEATTARNMGTLEGITKVNASAGVEDPVVFFITVRDNLLCKECRRVHLMPDGTTPRVWRLSELSFKYHKVGEDAPCVGGLHPHCRCTMVTLMPGFGFDASGRIKYEAPGHDEFARQRPD
jgi:hypothetical protein